MYLLYTTVTHSFICGVIILIWTFIEPIWSSGDKTWLVQIFTKKLDLPKSANKDTLVGPLCYGMGWDLLPCFEVCRTFYSTSDLIVKMCTFRAHSTVGDLVIISDNRAVSSSVISTLLQAISKVTFMYTTYCTQQ